MNKKVVISIALFLCVMCILGLPFTNWWFFGADDFHALYLGYETKTFKQLLYHFIDGNIAKGAGPSNYIPPPVSPSFLTVYYRPLYLVYLTLQYWFFGANAYYYHLCNVFFHALNTALLFTIFCWFSPIIPALLAAFFFAVHPQIGYRFGAIVNLHYYINISLLLGVVILYKQWLDTRKAWHYVLACILFGLSLLTRESSIIFPGILFLGTLIYKKKDENSLFTNPHKRRSTFDVDADVVPLKKHCRYSLLSKYLSIVQKIAGFIAVACTFLTWRLYLYPLRHTTTASSLPSLISKMPEFKVFLFDLFTFSWLPWAQPLLRGGVLTGCITALLILFITCTKKIEVSMLFCCGILMLWPMLMGPYSPRYFYETWPFFLAGFLVCCVYQPVKLILAIKPFALAFLGALSCWYTIFCYDSFSRRTIKHNYLSEAVYKLVEDERVHQRTLCFLCQPLDGMGDQNPDIFRILLNQPQKIIYFDSSTAIIQADQNIVKPTRWGNMVSSYHDQNHFSVTPINGGFRFQTLDSSKIIFNLNTNGYSLGKKIVHQAQCGMVTDFSLLIDQMYIDHKPLFIIWDFKKMAFCIHESF